MTDPLAGRVRGFRIHLAAYAVVGAALLLTEYLMGGGLHWSIFFLVGWGAPLAIHVAYVMGLLDKR